MNVLTGSKECWNQHGTTITLFSEMCMKFLKCAWNLEHFQKEDEYRSLMISEIIDAERCGYLNV